LLLLCDCRLWHVLHWLGNQSRLLCRQKLSCQWLNHGLLAAWQLHNGRLLLHRSLRYVYGRLLLLMLLLLLMHLWL